MAISSSSPLPALGLFIMIGLLGAGFFTKSGIEHMRRADRYVTVKGLSEREVKADLATWPIRFKVTGDELFATQKAMEDTQTKVLNFLKGQGFTDTELELRPLRVIDRQAREYGDNRATDLRYIMDATVMVRTAEVDRVAKVSQMVSDLVKSGVVLFDEGNCDVGPKYSYTQFNALKPEMLAEATKKARESAEQFAKDSGSDVGTIRQAYQGIFSISSRDYVADNSEGSGGCGDSSAMKKVRVVTTIDYFLEN